MIQSKETSALFLQEGARVHRRSLEAQWNEFKRQTSAEQESGHTSVSQASGHPALEHDWQGGAGQPGGNHRSGLPLVDVISVVYLSIK